MPLRGPLRQMREQNYAGGITGRIQSLYQEKKGTNNKEME